MKWEIPETKSDGVIRIQCRPRFVDARVISARKLMIRAGISAAAEACVPVQLQVCTPGEVPEDVQLLINTYPVSLAQEAGEKEFVLDEDITLPSVCPAVEKIVYYCVNPEITERRVSADKVIFKGNANLHILYRSEENKLHACDLLQPFSQLLQLENTYSTDAQADVIPCVTSLELMLENEGDLRLKCGMVGQYTVLDRHMIQLVEDAYSPLRELEMRTDELKLPAILENRQESILVEQQTDQNGGTVIESYMSCDQPRQMRSGDQVTFEIPGQSGVLFYAEDGSLRSSTGRWERNFVMMADDTSQLTATTQPCASSQSVIGAEGITVQGECLLSISARATQGMKTVTGFTLGEPKNTDPDRPSLVLRRVGERSLWQIAKESGSTVDAICKANGLVGEPEHGKMLLIPIE